MERKIFIKSNMGLGYRQMNGEQKLSSNGGSLKTRKKILKKTPLYKGNQETSKNFYHTTVNPQ